MKMIGKLNEKSKDQQKTDDFVDGRNTGGIVILLMVFIVKSGTSCRRNIQGRSSQALALVFEDPQTLEDMASERENSSFTDKEKETGL